MNFEIGHHEIDHHHEELFSLDTMLDKAVRSCRRSSLEPIIEFLEHYSDEHFREEEDLMKEHDYGGYALHKSEHDKFAIFVKDLRLMYTEEKPTAHLIFGIRRLMDQLIHHIKTVDSGMKVIPKESI